MAAPLWDHEVAELQPVADRLGLSVDEVVAARSMGMSPERYAALKGARSVGAIRAAVAATSGEAA